MPGNSLEWLPQHPAAAELEWLLCDPFDERSELSLAKAVELDEREAVPEAFVALLCQWG